MQYHLRAIRLKLDLKDNARHRVLWALWTVKWQRCFRAGDLIRGKKGGDAA